MKLVLFYFLNKIQLLADPNLVSKMKNLDVYNISPKVEKNIKNKIASNENFNPARLATI